MQHGVKGDQTFAEKLIFHIFKNMRYADFKSFSNIFLYNTDDEKEYVTCYSRPFLMCPEADWGVFKEEPLTN